MRVKAHPPAEPATHVALLRGINVGGKNMLSMKALAGLCEAEGCSCVRTYIQSGNVLFRAPKARAARLAAALAARIERDHGLTVPVVLRTVSELEQVARSNPFLPRSPAAELHVMFLADEPSKTALAGLDLRRSPPDTFVVVGREVYLRLPNGAARTKLSNAWFDGRLATTSTMRNWRTVLELVALARS
jgi:uncharacterized protein (DUF1697 family)